MYRLSLLDENDNAKWRKDLPSTCEHETKHVFRLITSFVSQLKYNYEGELKGMGGVKIKSEDKVVIEWIKDE